MKRKCQHIEEKHPDFFLGFAGSGITYEAFFSLIVISIEIPLSLCWAEFETDGFDFFTASANVLSKSVRAGLSLIFGIEAYFDLGTYS